MPKHYIIPVFVPHYGCPHDCVFCNQKKITGLSTNVRADEVESIILTHLDYFRKDSFIEVAFYGGSFTAIDIDKQKELLRIPYEYKKRGIINEIRLSTRPDAIDEEILHILKDYGVDTIELGVQSLSMEVLDLSDRGHSVDDVYKAVNLIRQFDIKLGLQMMLGLPGDSNEKSLKTCLEFIRIKPDCVRIYPTLVIKDTFLERQYIEGTYKPLTLEEAIEQSCIYLMLFNLNKIDVIRVGLQPTENIQLGKDVVAGPFHPAFRQVVEAYIYRLLFDLYFSKCEIEKENKEMIIQAHRSKISSISGQYSVNTKYFRERYKFSKVRIYEKDIDDSIISITIGAYCDKINIEKLMKEYVEKFH